MKTERFEWDDGKARQNLFKHGIGFDEAKGVFDDVNALVEPDDGEPHEERWTTIGLVVDRVLYVVSTERNGTIRMISARRADRNEQDRYYRQTRL